MSDATSNIDFPLPDGDDDGRDPAAGGGPPPKPGLDDDPADITLREDDDPPRPHRDADDEPYDGSTFGLGPATPTLRREDVRPLSEPTLPSDAAPPPRTRRPAESGGGNESAPPPRTRPAKSRTPQADADDERGPGKPKLRDWLETRCRKEAKMYALAVAALAPVAFAATSFTWGILRVLAPGSGFVEGALAAAMTAGLFMLERVTRESRSVRLRVEPDDRDVKPVSLKLPRGAGLTWLMYLAGSRDHAGFVRFVLAVLLFGPRLCELVFKMGRTAKRLWDYDADLMAGPLKTLVKAEGKVGFGAFLEAHRSPPPQELVDRLALIDGVLFLPTSSPPGLCASEALKDEFAAWRERWHEERRAGDRLYD